MAGSEYDLTFGIKADAKQAKKEIKDIVVQAQSIAKDIQSALEATKGSRKGTQLRQLRDEMNVTSKEVKQASNAFSLYQAVLGQTAAAEKRLSDVRNDKDRKNLKKSLSRYTVKRDNLDANDPGNAAKLEKYNTKIAEIESKLKPSNDEIEKLTSKITNLKARAAGLRPLAKAFVDEYGKAGATAREILDIVNKTATSTGDLSGKANQINDGFDKAKTSANGAKDALDGLTSKENKANEAKAKTATATVKEDTSIKGLLDTLSKYQAQLARTQRAGQDTADIEEKIAATTEKLNDKFKFSSASENIADVTRRLLEMQQAKRELESAGIPKQFAGQYTQIVTEIELLKQSISDYKKSLHDTQVAHETTAKSSKKLFSGLKKLPSIVGVLKDGFNSLSKTLHRVRGSFDSMARNMRSNFKHMLSNITKYVLGFRSLFFLVRRLRKYIGEGIQNLAQFNDGNNIVNESITDMLSSLLFLKNAWAAAFSPIITYVRPILVKLIDDLAEVGNAVARFMSALLGQEIAFNAVRIRAQDYADSLDNVGGSAGSAADKTKKLTDRLAAFDDLNVLGVDKDPDETGSGGGGGLADQYVPDPNEMFTIVDPEENGFLKMLKDAWENADFSIVGSTIKDKIIAQLQGIDWDSVQGTGIKIGSSLGSFIAGLFGDPELFKAAGTTIGEALNTITYTVQAFLDWTDGIDFGGNLAEGFNTFLDVTDWQTAGDNINRIITGITGNIDSFITTLDADKVVTAIKDFMTRLNIKEIVASVTKLALDVTNLALTVTGGLVWEWGQSFGDSLIKWVKEDMPSAYTDENGIKVPMSIDMTPTFDYDEHPLAALLERIQTGLGKAILNKVLNVEDLSPDELADLTDSWNRVVNKLFKAVVNTFTLGTGTGGIITSLLNPPKDEEGNTDWEQIGYDIADGIWIGMGKSLKKIGDNQWIRENIYDPFWEAVSNIFDMHSPSKVTEEWGGWIGEGLLNGVANLIPDVEQIFIDLKDWLSGKWDEIKGNTYEKWVGIKTNVLTKAGEIKDQAEEKFEILKTNLTNKWQEIKGAIYEKLVGIKTNMKEVFEQMGDAIKAPINTIIDIIEGMVNKAIDGINALTEGLGALTDLGSEIASKIGMPTIPHLGQLSHISIPHLAQGAVIPPNREFMAVLGDQSNGTNIEAPLDTIKQAVAEVLANNGNAEMIQLLQQLITVVENKNLVIGDKDIGRANARYVKQQNIVRGSTF